MANPQSWNRYSYVQNNPINAFDPTGHYCVGEMEGCRDDVNGTPVNGAALYLHEEEKADEKLKKDKPIEEMKPGDIITFDVMINGKTVTYNYMMGVLEDNTWGFWDLDAHKYIEYALAVDMVGGASTWNTFKKADPKTFNSYEVMASSGTPHADPSFNVSWTGGMDDNPAYVEIRTIVDRENAPTAFAWAILGPGLVSSFWMDAKPSITPLSQAGYYPLTNYVAAWKYLATDGVATERYPVIHP